MTAASLLLAGLLAQAHVDIPRAAAPPVVDGKLVEEAWRTAEWHSGAFLGPDGKPLSPFSEAHLTTAGSALYLGLYAADLDINTRGPEADRFWLELRAGGRVVQAEVGPDGKLSARPCAAGDRCVPLPALRKAVKAGIDADGTVDVRGDLDEEWIVELAIPFKLLALRAGDSLEFAVGRCDVVRSGERVCTRYPAAGHARAVLAPGREGAK